jgi:HEAT repeat protein
LAVYLFLPRQASVSRAPEDSESKAALADRAAQERKAARQQSQKSLHEIALAFLNVADTQGRFPPSLLADQSGRVFRGPQPGVAPMAQPLLSWRVLILPYLSEDRLFQQFKLNEPWDGPHNKKLLARMPAVYAPPAGTNAEPYSTYYKVFVGPQTPFPTPPPQFRQPPAPPDFMHGGLGLAQITDGTSNTFLVAEAGEAVPWTKPADLPYEANRPLPRLGGLFPEGFHAAFFDGKVLFVPRSVKEETVRAMITSTGGELVDREELLREQLRRGEALLFRGKEAAAWMEQMKSPKADARVEAVRGLTEMIRDVGRMPEAKAQIEEARRLLLQAVTDWDGGVANEAIRSLGQAGIEADAAVPALLAAFPQVEDTVPQEIQQPQEQMGQAAVAPLCKALESEDYEIRARAAYLLGEMWNRGQLDKNASRVAAAYSDRINQALDPGGKGPVPLEDVLTLVELLYAKSAPRPGWPTPRLQAAAALSRTGPFGRLAIPTLYARSRQEGFLITAQSKAGAFQETVEHHDGGGFQRQPLAAALEALHRAKADAVCARLAPRVVQELISLMHRPRDLFHRDMSVWAVQELGRLGPAALDAIPSLLQILRSRPPAAGRPPEMPDWHRGRGVRASRYSPMQIESVRTLGKIGPAARDAVKDIERWLKDGEEEDRLIAAEALLQIDPGSRDRALPVLKEVLKSENDFVAVDAALVLVRHGAADRSAVEALVRSEADPGHALANRMQHVAEQLKSLQPEAAKRLVDAGRPLLVSKDSRTRWTVARILAPFDPPQCLPVLREIVQENRGDGLREVAGLIARLRPRANDLSALLQKKLKEASRQTGFGATTQTELISALAAVDPEGAAPVLFKMWRELPEADPKSQIIEPQWIMNQHDAYGTLLEHRLPLRPFVQTLLKDLEAPAANPEMMGWLVAVTPERSGRLLAQIGPPVVPDLVEMTKGKKPLAQARAIAVLGQLGTDARAAVPRLLELLGAEDAGVRREAAIALGRIAPHDSKVSAGLRALHQDRDVEVRRAVARALGSVGAEAKETLAEMLEDADENVCRAATASLGRLGKEVVPALGTALKHRSLQVRRMAVLALGNQEPDAAGVAAGLIEAAQGPDRYTRRLAGALLDRFGADSDEIMAALVAALSDDDARVRWTAAFVLEELGSDRADAVPALEKALDDRDHTVRRRALLALRALGGKARPAQAAIRKILVAEPEANGPRTAEEDLADDAAITLLQVAPEPAAVLAEAVQEASGNGRTAAVNALVRLGPDAVPVLLQLTRAREADVRLRGITCLAEAGVKPEVFVPRLIELLDDGNILVRRQAIATLGSFGPAAAQAEGPLRKIVASPQDLAHDAAGEALRQIKPEG